MAYPSEKALEAIFDGSLGDAIVIKAVSEGAADAYGEKIKSYSAGTAARGRAIIVSADEKHKEFGYLQPGDAIALLKLTATVALNDLLVFGSNTYEVIGIVTNKTHLEIAAKRVT